MREEWTSKDFWHGRKVLITGGMGFIGSNLAHRLVALGAKVRILDNMDPELGANPFNLEGIREQVEVLVGDVREPAVVEKALNGVTVVYHLAAQVSHVDSLRRPFHDLEVNARGTLVVLEAVRKVCPEARFVYGGTRGQYGEIYRRPVDEQHPTIPFDIYGANKQAGELYTLVYGRVHGLDVVSLRINNTYGERHQMKHPKYGVLNWFIRLALEDQEIPIFGEGEQLREYNYVADVVDALVRVGQAPELPHRIYNLGTGEPVPFRRMAELIVKICGSGRLKFVPYPEDRKPLEVGDFYADIRRIREDLGWQPVTPLEEGLRRTIDFYRRYRAYYW